MSSKLSFQNTDTAISRQPLIVNISSQARLYWKETGKRKKKKEIDPGFQIPSVSTQVESLLGAKRTDDSLSRKRRVVDWFH